MRIGIYVSAGARAPLDALLDEFARVDAAGFHTAWLGQTFELDALTALALAGTVTRTVELGSWVIPIQPRHPTALAQLAATAQAACGGRLVLGVGVSHEAVIARRFGLDYARPLRHAQEYLEVLIPLLRGDAVAHAGERYRVQARLEVTGEPPPVLLAALGPEMLALAGRATDGAAIWLGGPRYLEELAVPTLHGAAEDAGREGPRIACGLPVAITSDVEAARRSAHAFLAQSSKLPAYQRVLELEGVDAPEDVALIGEDAKVLDALDQLAVLGVTDFNAVLFDVDGDPDARTRSFELLARLARLS